MKWAAAGEGKKTERERTLSAHTGKRIMSVGYAKLVAPRCVRPVDVRVGMCQFSVQLGKEERQIQDSASSVPFPQRELLLVPLRPSDPWFTTL